MKFQVLQHHIDDGVPEHPCLCPIALAVDEKLNHALEVSVGVHTITIGGCKFKLPAKATEFVCSFDGNNEAEPFEFELNLEEFNK